MERPVLVSAKAGRSKIGCGPLWVLAELIFGSMDLVRSSCLCVLVSFFSGCRKPEPVEYGSYHIANNTSFVLNVVLTSTPNNATLHTVWIPSEHKVKFMDVVMGSGGHLLPSNFLSSFKLTVEDSVVYEGVRNGDWEREWSFKGHHHYVLTIP